MKTAKISIEDGVRLLDALGVTQERSGIFGITINLDLPTPLAMAERTDLLPREGRAAVDDATLHPALFAAERQARALAEATAGNMLVERIHRPRPNGFALTDDEDDPA
jgi:hypothetical protein